MRGNTIHWPLLDLLSSLPQLLTLQGLVHLSSKGQGWVLSQKSKLKAKMPTGEKRVSWSNLSSFLFQQSKGLRVTFKKDHPMIFCLGPEKRKV